VRLIQGIYESEPLNARRIVRNRILTTAARPTEMCWGMVRMAAKRMSGGIRVEDHPLPPGHTLVELGEVAVPTATLPIEREPQESWMSFACRLAAQVEPLEHRYQSNRRIAALLVSPQDELLGWALNSNSNNKTLHAEVKLIQAFCNRAGSRVPPGTRLYTTLKSCKMCAGMIWESAGDPAALKVYFAENEPPGPKLWLTVLDPGSFERERACASRPDCLPLILETQLVS
jgi:tRNA(Arg) A34 adenosine deaminase TadA